ncbi:hypothetical protein NA57DRAFT_24389, partial [Rhizodiscina lignyota]
SAIALFRALLSQSRAATGLHVDTRTAIQNAVRNRFRSNANLVSVRRSKIAYHAGYHGLDLLDSCVAGDDAATKRIEELIEKTPADVKAPPKPKAPKLSKQEEREARGEPEGLWGPSPLALPPPGKKMVDQRPYLEIKGERRVPQLVVATRLPFLRFKPQPENLSRFIRQKLGQKQRRMNYANVLQQYYFPLAEMEDTWDDVV